MQLVVFIVLLSLCLDTRSTLAFKSGNKIIKLDMAKNSAAYIFTQTPAADDAAISYIRKEWAERSDFLEVWDAANESLGQAPDIPRNLRREHVIAIRPYSQKSPLYREFNAATRKYGMNDTIYQEKFHFKSFHYFLSVALRKLKEKKRVTYRGAQMLFNATEGVKVRLAQFASSSLDQSEAIGFLKEMSSENTLFEIKTMFGVPISEFSYFPDEEEVLIPPIEVFKVKSAPVREKNGSQSWVKITLAARRCQGFIVTVQTRNGALEVKRGKGKCPKRCRCILG